MKNQAHIIIILNILKATISLVSIISLFGFKSNENMLRKINTTEKHHEMG
jgi:hypothetical protein